MPRWLQVARGCPTQEHSPALRPCPPRPLRTTHLDCGSGKARSPNPNWSRSWSWSWMGSTGQTSAQGNEDGQGGRRENKKLFQSRGKEQAIHALWPQEYPVSLCPVPDSKGHPGTRPQNPWPKAHRSSGSPSVPGHQFALKMQRRDLKFLAVPGQAADHMSSPSILLGRRTGNESSS